MITYLLDKLLPDPPLSVLVQRLTLKDSVIRAHLPLRLPLGFSQWEVPQEVRERQRERKRQTERKNCVPRSSRWPSLSAATLNGPWFHLFAHSGLWLMMMASQQITALGHFIILGWFPSALPTSLYTVPSLTVFSYTHWAGHLFPADLGWYKGKTGELYLFKRNEYDSQSSPFHYVYTFLAAPGSNQSLNQDFSSESPES